MKSYLLIMKDAIASSIKNEKKPDLSMKDWKFVLECLVTLESICRDMDDINAERFKLKCEINFEVLEDITGHEIL